MAITIPIKITHKFAVKVGMKEVWDVLSNVPASASFYPQVDKLMDLGDGAYCWNMEKIGAGQASAQIVYACFYSTNRQKGTVTWTPIAGVGNAQVAGSWQVSQQKSATLLVLTVEGSIGLPLPALMSLVVQPVVEAEFERLTETYIANLCVRFGGEVEKD